jgi:hypothetical protein
MLHRSEIGGCQGSGSLEICAPRASYEAVFSQATQKNAPELLPPCATNERQEVFRCCGEDEGRPLGVAFQREAPNRPLLLRPKGVVVSEWESRGETAVGTCQGDERKRTAENVSKKLFRRCRNRWGSDTTGSSPRGV